MNSLIRDWIQNLMTEFRRFSIAEVVMFKTCLISVGILFGLFP